MSKKENLYQTVIDHFKKEIEAGRLKPGDRIPTEFELADMFNVSRITITRAVKDLEAMGLIYRVKRKGSFVREPLQPAVPLQEICAPLRQPIISIILPFNESVAYGILRGAQQECEKRGYYITFHNSFYDSGKERKIIEKLMNDRLSGIIVYPYHINENIDLYSNMLISKFPFVFIDKAMEGFDVPCVVSNNYMGAYDIVKHLITLGHKRIAYVCSSLVNVSTELERYKGYCRALVDAGIVLDPRLIIDNFLDTHKLSISPACAHDVHIDASNRLLDRLMTLDQPPTAVFMVNDYAAVYFMKAALKMGIDIPGKLSLVGFDNLEVSSHLEVPLTTVEQDFDSMGQKAVQLLLQSDDEKKKLPQKIILDTKLIVRQSSDVPS